MRLFKKKHKNKVNKSGFSYIQKDTYEQDIRKGIYYTVVFKKDNNNYYYEWDYDKFSEEEAIEKSSKLFNEGFVGQRIGRVILIPVK